MFRRSRIILYLAFALASFICYADAQNTDAWLAEINIAGPEELVFDYSQDACEVWDIPDIPARAFRDAKGQVQLLASHYITRRMTGPDLNHLKHDCQVIMASTMDPDPEDFDDHEWISSTYTPDGVTVYALIHDEYHGAEHDNQCTSKVTINCWYNAVTLAISVDGGNSYTQKKAPGQFVAGIPYRYAPNTGPVGIFGPSNIIHNDNDGYYYVFFRGIVPGQKSPGHRIGVMRTQHLSDPASWRAWDGQNFNIRFVDPYTEELEPGNMVFSPISPQALGDMVPSSITWNTYLKRYIMISTGHVTHPISKEVVWALTYSTSEDLIHWTPRQYLKQVVQTGKFKPGDPDPIAYPSALDPDSTSRNFETTGKKFYIYYTRFNYNSLKKSPLKADRDLARVPVELGLVSKPH